MPPYFSLTSPPFYFSDVFIFVSFIYIFFHISSRYFYFFYFFHFRPCIFSSTLILLLLIFASPVISLHLFFICLLSLISFIFLLFIFFLYFPSPHIFLYSHFPAHYFPFIDSLYFSSFLLFFFSSVFFPVSSRYLYFFSIF